MNRKSRTEKRFKSLIREETRPWGKFRSYPHALAKSLKIITVNPGAALSLQYHHRRSEFWVVLDKGLEITIGGETWQPKKGEEVFIPEKAPHRLRCVGTEPARVMEVWIGRSTENDIVRLQDNYGRIPSSDSAAPLRKAVR